MVQAKWIWRGIVMATFGWAVATGCSQQSSSGTRDGQVLAADRPDSEAVKEPPITAKTRVAAGELAETRGVPTVAIQQYREALKLEPTNRVATYRIALLYTSLHDFQNAVPAWNQYIAISKGSADGYSDLGLCHELAGSLPEAEAAYRAGIEQEPSNTNCRINYGVMLARTGRIKESLQQFQAVLSPAEAHYDLGSVYEQQGKRDLARLEYKSALELDPTLADARWRLTHMD